MFRWIIGNSPQFRFLVLGASTALLVFSAQQLQRMPVDVFPEFAPPKIEIHTAVFIFICHNGAYAALGSRKHESS